MKVSSGLRPIGDGQPVLGQCFDVRPPGSVPLLGKKRLCCLFGARDAAQVTNEQRTREVAVRALFRQAAEARRRGDRCGSR